eukprot:3321330-Prymnesium_polylepis.1
MQPTSVGNRQLFSPRTIAGRQQALGPPGRTEQPAPSHVPHNLRQHTDAGLFQAAIKSERSAYRPAVQSP